MGDRLTAGLAVLGVQRAGFGFVGFKTFQPPQLGIDFLRRLLANVACIEDNKICPVRRRGDVIAQGL